jgi:hypothetical protein
MRERCRTGTLRLSGYRRAGNEMSNLPHTRTQPPEPNGAVAHQQMPKKWCGYEVRKMPLLWHIIISFIYYYYLSRFIFADEQHAMPAWAMLPLFLLHYSFYATFQRYAWLLCITLCHDMREIIIMHFAIIIVHIIIFIYTIIIIHYYYGLPRDIMMPLLLLLSPFHFSLLLLHYFRTITIMTLLWHIIIFIIIAFHYYY